MTEKSQIQIEVDKNYDFFKQELPKIIIGHLGQFVLLRHQAIIDYFDTFEDAQKYAIAMYKDELFSVQKVEDTVLNLGFIGTQIHA